MVSFFVSVQTPIPLPLSTLLVHCSALEEDEGRVVVVVVAVLVVVVVVGALVVVVGALVVVVGALVIVVKGMVSAVFFRSANRELLR